MSITGAAARDRRLFEGFLSGLARCPPDYLQVRDKSAADRSILGLLREARERLPATRVLANSRFDLALAAGAAGVVLPADGLPVASVRRETPRGFVVGKSTHSSPEALQALEDGADLILLGPIFDTPSKRPFGPPLGPGILARIPPGSDRGGEVLAIGGITLDNLAELLPYRNRLDGIAAIRLFEDAVDPAAAVQAVRDR